MQWMYVYPIAPRAKSSGGRSPLFIFLLCALAIAPLSASSPQPPASQQTATAAIVNVSTEPELQAAVAALASDTTVVLAPGTYVLSKTLVIPGALSNVVIRGATENSSDVVLVGRGAANADFGAVPHGIAVGGSVQGITIANLTIRDVYTHAILFAAGTDSPRIANVTLTDAGQQFIKVSAEGAAPVSNGTLERSVVEATTPSRDVNASAIDIEGGSRWTIKNNVFRNLQAPEGQVAQAAVLVRDAGRDTIVEGNTFVDNQQEIALGLADGDSPDHTGGIVRNNFIARKAGVAGGPAISVANSPDTQVLHNTVLTNGGSEAAIELRFAGTRGAAVRNNLSDGTVVAREGATGTVADNYTTATAALFVDAGSGDLHLAPSATAVMDRVGVVAGATVDWDGEARPQGGSADYGADEYSASAIAITATAAPAPATADSTTLTSVAPTITSTVDAPAQTATLSATAAATTLPAPWTTMDVGNATPAGSAAYDSGTFTVRGGGPSIGGSADQFRFVYQTLDGDGEIVARVDDVQRTHPWAKAGVMFRDELTEGSAHAFAFVAAGQGPGFEYRQSNGATSTQTTTGSRTMPAFVKVIRKGNTFSAYMSANGSAWSQMGTQTISMNKLVYVGLAVSSRNTKSLSTATFNAVSVTAGAATPDPEPDPDPPANQAPTVAITSPAAGAIYTAPATIQLAATASDPDGSIVQVDFYVGKTLVGTELTSPYTGSWSTSTAGTYVVTAIARDNAGAWTTSAPVSISVAAAPVALPRYVVFRASVDHSTKVTSYTVEFFTAGSDPSKATPVRTLNVGKPTPVNGDIQVDVAATVQALPAGTYVTTVKATGSGGSARSTPSESFVR